MESKEQSEKQPNHKSPIWFILLVSALVGLGIYKYVNNNKSESFAKETVQDISKTVLPNDTFNIESVDTSKSDTTKK